MVEELNSVTEAGRLMFRKRKMMMGHGKKAGKAKKKQKGGVPFNEKRVKIDKRMKKIYEKRARDYNSDNDDDDDDEDNDVDNWEPTRVVRGKKPTSYHKKEDDDFDGEFLDDDGGEGGDEDKDMSEDEDGEILPGITKLMDGCKAFRLAFKKILKSSSDDILGPVLSAHKNLVLGNLLAEEEERKVKGEAKREKHLIGEKGHVKPANYLDAHEKLLIGVATKGVVKLFNAVNKAQHAQKGLNPSRSKDEKAIKKRRREAFFSELGKRPSQTAVAMSKGGASSSSKGEGPSWAPLCDNYMLTNPKLKDWDKNPDTTVADDVRMSADSDSSDDE